MNERDLTDELETWLAEPTPPFDDHALFQTIDRLPSVPRRRRWWPFRWFPLGIGATRSARSAAPRPERRSTSMFTGTRVAATVAILALSGSLALYVVLPQPEPSVVAPAAVTEEPDASTDGIHVSGRVDFIQLASDPPPNYGVTIEHEDGSSTYRDARFETIWTADDPRFVGSGDYTAHSNTYPLNGTDAVTVGWGTQSLATEDGAWIARPENSFGVLVGDESVIPMWLDGEGAYEGRSALLIQRVQPDARGGWFLTFDGWVVPGDAHFEDALE